MISKVGGIESTQVLLAPVKQLPVEICMMIFSFLDPFALTECCQVNKQWSEIANDDVLWKRYFTHIKIPEGISPKRFLLKHAIMSKSDVEKRLRDFLETVPLNCRARFICYAPFKGKKCQISADLGFGRGESIKEPRMQKICILMEKALPKTDSSEPVDILYIGDLRYRQGVFNENFYRLSALKLKLPETESTCIFDYESKIEDILHERLDELELDERLDELEDGAQEKRSYNLEASLLLTVVIVGFLFQFYVTMFPDEYTD